MDIGFQSGIISLDGIKYSTPDKEGSAGELEVNGFTKEPEGVHAFFDQSAIGVFANGRYAKNACILFDMFIYGLQPVGVGFVIAIEEGDEIAPGLQGTGIEAISLSGIVFLIYRILLSAR